MAATAASDSTDGPVLSLINKRLRALRKKHNRILQMEESVAQGKSLNKEQEDVVRSKTSVLASIDELEKLRPQLSAAVQEELSLAVQRHQVSPPSDESQPAREDSELKDLLNLLYFGALFDVKSQSDFTATMLTRTHERGCCLTYDYVTDDNTDLLAEKDLDAISSLGSLLISRPVDTSLSHKNALDRCLEHAKLWLTRSNQAIEPISGASYAALREKLNKIMVSDYFTATPEMNAPVDVAASGNYVPFQVQADASTLQVTEQPMEDEVGPDARHEQKGDDQGEVQEQNEPIQATQVEEFSKHEAEEEDTSEAPPQAQSEEPNDQQPEEEFNNQQKDRDMNDQRFQSRRPYQNHRGGRGGGGAGGRRGYYGAGRGGRGGNYQMGGRQQHYDQPGNFYQPRGYYSNNRGRGRGGRSGGGGGGGYSYNNHHHNHGGPIGGGHGPVDVGVVS